MKETRTDSSFIHIYWPSTLTVRKCFGLRIEYVFDQYFKNSRSRQYAAWWRQGCNVMTNQSVITKRRQSRKLIRSAFSMYPVGWLSLPDKVPTHIMGPCIPITPELLYLIKQVFMHFRLTKLQSRLTWTEETRHSHHSTQT